MLRVHSEYIQIDSGERQSKERSWWGHWSSSIPGALANQYSQTVKTETIATTAWDCRAEVASHVTHVPSHVLWRSLTVMTPQTTQMVIQCQWLSGLQSIRSVAVVVNMLIRRYRPGVRDKLWRSIVEVWLVKTWWPRSLMIHNPVTHLQPMAPHRTK